MIRVKRAREPEILSKNKRKWLTDYLSALDKCRLNPSLANKQELARAERKYNHREVKEALNSMFAGKCAYCESHILHIGFGHIEHYRPKSKYPKKCFLWSNLLLGCEVCNSKQFKGSKFPTTKQKGPIVNPAKEDPNSYLEFEYDPGAGTANVIGLNDRGDTSLNILGLNRPELVIHRSKIVRRMAVVAINASKGDAEALLEIRKCCHLDEEYSAFARSLCLRYGITI